MYINCEDLLSLFVILSIYSRVKVLFCCNADVLCISFYGLLGFVVQTWLTCGFKIDAIKSDIFYPSIFKTQYGASLWSKVLMVFSSNHILEAVASHSLVSSQCNGKWLSVLHYLNCTTQAWHKPQISALCVNLVDGYNSFNSMN